MIGHTNEGMRAGWFLDSVQILVPVHGRQYMFPSHRWLCKDEADGKTEVEIYPSEILDMEQCRHHQNSHTHTHTHGLIYVHVVQYIKAQILVSFKST